MIVFRLNSLKPFALAFIFILFSWQQASGQCNPPTPTANFTYSPSLLCDSVNVQFSNTSNGAAMTYSWNFGDPASGASNSSTAANPSHIFKVGSQPDTFDVRLVVLDFCGKRDTLIKQLIVAPKPVADFEFTDSLCAGILSFRNLSQGSGLNFNWSFGDGLTGNQSDTIIQHFYDTIGVGMASYQVRLIAISPNGCADTITKVRKVKMSPDPTIDDFTSTIPFSQCSSTAGFLLSIDNSSITYTTNTGYIINWGDGTPRDTLSSTFFSDTHTYHGFGRFRLAVTALGSNGCNRTDTFNVYNGSNPSGGMSSPGSTINLCAPVRLGFPITSVQNNTPGTNYTFWVNDSTNVQNFLHPPPDTIFHQFLKSSCGTNLQGTPAYTNAFMLTLLITNPCGQTSATIAPITLSGKPEAAVSADKDTACVLREIVTLTDNSSSNTVLPTGNFNCATDMLRRWRVNRPVGDYELQTGSFLGGANFTSSTVVGPGPNHNGSGQLQVRFLDTGEFVFRLISGHPNNACGYDTIEYKIYVQDTVVAAFALNMNPSNGCVDNVISTQNLSTGPVQRYNWTVTPSNGFSFVNSTADSAEPVLRFSEAGEYTIRMEAIGVCNTDDTFTTVIIRDIPEVTLPGDAEFCGPQNFNFSTSPFAPTIDTNYSSLTGYRWQIQGGAYQYLNTTDSSMLNPVVDFQDTGIYRIIFYAYNSCGISLGDTMNVRIKPIPEITADLSGILWACPGDSVFPPLITAIPAGSTFSWSNNNVAVGLGASGTGQIPDFLAAINQTGNTIESKVSLIASFDGCNSPADTLFINIRPTPSVNPMSDINVCSGDTVYVPDFASSPVGASFFWKNSNDTIGLDTAGTGNIADFIASLNNSASSITGRIIYSALLNGCPGEADTFHIHVLPRAEIIPRNDTVLCPNAQVNTIAIQTQPANVDLRWYNSNTLIGLPDSGTGNLPNFTSSNNPGLTNISATIIVIPELGSCKGIQDTFQIEISPSPKLDLINDSIFCPGDSILIPAFSATPIGSQIYWFNSDTLIGLSSSGTGNLPGFVALPNLSATNRVASIRVLPELNTCRGLADTFQLTIKPTPQTIYLADTAFCPGDSIIFPAFVSNPNGASFEWSNQDTSIGLVFSGNGNLPRFKAIPNNSLGTISSRIKVIPTLNNCIGLADSFLLSIKPTPQLSALSNISVCPFDSILVDTFKTLPAGGSFQWFNNNLQIDLGASGNGQVNPYRAPDNTNTSSLLAQIKVNPVLNQCPGLTDSFTIEIKTKPQVNAGTDEVICEGGSIQIGQLADTLTSYSWMSNPLGFNSLNATELVGPDSTTLYILTAFDSITTCLNADSVRIEVNPEIINNTILQDQIICAGQSPAGLQGNSPSGGNSNYSFQWQISEDSVNWSNIPTATNSNYNPPVLVVNTHYRRITISGPCSDTSNVVRIIVTPGISNNLIGDTDSLCAYSLSDTLRGTLPIGGSSSFGYSWYSTTDTTSQDTLITGAVGINFHPGLMTQTRFYRRMVNSGSCDTRSNWVEIRVKPKPVASFSVNNVCFELAHSFTNQSSIASGSIDSFFYDMGDGNTYQSPNPTHIYAASGSKQAELIVKSDFGCLDTTQRTFFTHPKPIAGFNLHDTCLELVNRFADTSKLSSGSLKGWAWQFGDGDTSSQQNPTKWYGDTGVFTVQLIVLSDSGCLDTASGMLEIHPKPKAGFISEVVCLNQTTHFTDSSSIVKGQIVFWNWNFGDLSSDTVQHPVKNYAVADTFDVVQLVRSDKGCLDTAFGSVIVYPSVSNNSISDHDTICAGSQSHAFTGSTPQGGTGSYAYQWEQSTDSLNWSAIPSANGLDLGAQTLFTTTYFRRVISSSPCDSNERSISNTVVVIVTPGISNNTIGSDQTICYGQLADTTLGSNPTGGTGSFSYQWERSSNDTNWTAISGETGIHLLGNVLFDTIYYRRVVYSQACEHISNRIKIAVKPLPVVGFTQTNVCFPEGSVFSDTSTLNQGFISNRVFHFDDGDSSLSTNPTHFYASDGNYSVKLVVTSNFGCVDSLIKNHQVYPKPLSRMVQQNVCFPFSMNFYDSSIISSGSIVGWHYGFGDGDTSNQQHPTHTFNRDTTFLSSLIVSSNFGCKDTSYRQVRVWPKPLPNWGATEVCFPDTTQFVDSTTINTGQIKRWGWDFGDGNQDTVQNPSHQYTVFGTYQVKLIVLSDSNCLDSFIQSIEVRPLPVVAFNFDTLGCLNAPNPISNQTQGAIWYDWDFGDGNSDTAFEPSPAYSAIGQYSISLKATTAYGCIDSFKAPIRIIAPPQPEIELSLDSGCGPLQISFANHTIAEFQTYTWDFGNGNSSSDSFPGDQIYPPGHFSDTVYYILLKVENKCGLDSTIDSVLVLPQPSAVIGLNVNQGCSPFALPIMNISYGRPDSFIWIYGDGDTAYHSLLLHSHTYLTGLDDTTYYLSLIVSNKCGVDTGYGQVLIKPNTVTSFFNTDTTFGCAPMTVQFTDYSNGSDNLFYDFGDGNTTLQTDPKHTFRNPGSYRVQQFVDNGCSYDTSEITIQVLPSIEPKFIANKNQECMGTQFQFTNQSLGFGALRWYFGDGDSTDITNPSHAYSSAGNFDVRLKVFSALNGCPSEDTLRVNVLPLPLPQINLSVQQGCPPFTPIIQNNSTNAQFYEWHFGNGNTSVNHTPTTTYTPTGNYTLKLIARSAAGCFDSVTTNIEVFPQPTASFDFTLDNFCDTPATLTLLNTSQGASGFVWDFGGGNQSSVNNPVQVYNQFGVFSVALNVENMFGCTHRVDTVFEVYNGPRPDFTFNPPIGCMPLEVSFTNQTLGGSLYEWDFGNGDLSSDENPIYTYTLEGLYSVSLKATGAGNCVDSIALRDIITVHPKPVADFSYQLIDNEPMAQGLVRFTNQTGNVISYAWDFGDGNRSVVENPEHRYGFNGSYIVELAVENQFGCLDTVWKEIPLTFFKGLYVPNAFTPEYGIPEVRVFKPSGTALKTYHLQIFDTWGKLIWESKELSSGQPAEGWDGRVDGKLMAQDVYVWKITAEFEDGSTWPGMKGSDGAYRRTGTVTLLR